MGAIIRLVYGSDELDLDDATNFSVMPGFRPPAIARAVNLAMGTFRNKRGGRRAGSQPKDRNWSFPIKSIGASVTECHQGLSRLQSFLDRAADTSNKLYLEYIPSDAVSYRPLWGQLVYRYEIKEASLDIWDRYLSVINAVTIGATVNTIIGPHAIGLEQRVASAKGGVGEDILAATDGFSRGLQVGPTATNLNTNPSFETNTTSWAAHVTGTLARVTDFAAIGQYSCKITCPAANDGITRTIGSLTDTFWYTFSAYLTGPVGTDNLKITYYNGAANTTTTANGTGLGNWVRLEATAQQSGVTATLYIQGAAAGSVIYADAIQFENEQFATPYFDGTMLGCAWTGTAHASTSTRAVSYVRITSSTALRTGEGTIRVIWTPAHNQARAGDRVLFRIDTTGMYGAFVDTGNLFQFYDGTNVISSAAQTFSANTPMVLHFTYGPGSLKIYKDGTQVATGSTFTPLAIGSYVYIGTNGTPTGWSGGTFGGFTTWDRAFSATEALNDATDILQAAANDWVISPVPWLWTKDGDDRVDNWDESGTDNWCVIGGLPGSDVCETYIKGATAGSSDDDVYLGLFTMAMKDYIAPDFLTHIGAPDVVAVDTTDDTIYTLALTTAQYKLIAGLEIRVMLAANEDGTNNLSMRTGVDPGGAVYYYSNYATVSFRTVSTDTSLDSTPTVGLVDYDPTIDIFDLTAATNIRVTAKRASGGAANFNLTSFQVWPGLFARLVNLSAGGLSSGVFVYNSMTRSAREVNASAMYYMYAYRGSDIIEFEPGLLNVLLASVGTEAVYSTSGQTIDYVINIVPRWTLI